MKPPNLDEVFFCCNKDYVAHLEALNRLRQQIIDALDPIYLQALEVAKLHKTLNKTALDLIARDHESQPRHTDPDQDFTCSRLDILIDEDLRKCFDQACLILRDKYRKQVCCPGWADF